MFNIPVFISYQRPENLFQYLWYRGSTSLTIFGGDFGRVFIIYLTIPSNRFYVSARNAPVLKYRNWQINASPQTNVLHSFNGSNGASFEWHEMTLNLICGLWFFPTYHIGLGIVT